MLTHPVAFLATAMFLGPPPGFPPNGGPPGVPGGAGVPGGGAGLVPFGPSHGGLSGSGHERGNRSSHPPLPIEREQIQNTERSSDGERPSNGRPSPLNLSSPTTLKSGRHASLSNSSPSTPMTSGERGNQGQSCGATVRPSTSGTSSCHSSPSPKDPSHNLTSSASNLSMVLSSFQHLSYEQVQLSIPGYFLFPFLDTFSFHSWILLYSFLPIHF